jgi:type IV fimbrial biogenesis protein FimT
MLVTRLSRQGFTLIELLIGIALLGILLSLGVPSFSAWLQNMQVRNAAESIQNGLQLARAEAVRRNTPVSFAMPGLNSDWSVNVVAPAELVQGHSAAEGAANAQIATTNGTMSFDGLGKPIVIDGLGNITSLPAAALIQVTNPTGGACVTTIRCLNITVSVGGQIKMCDPNPSVLPGDSRHC